MKQKVITFGGARPAPPARRGQPRRRKRRTGRQGLHYLLILLVALAIFALLSLTVFFKIEKLEVTGNTKYANASILNASGVKVGDNLFRVSQRAVEKALKPRFPYVEEVRLKRAFPPKLTIEIKEAEPLGAVNTSMGYVVIGRSGMILEAGSRTLPADMTVVNGMYLSLPKVGRKLGTAVAEEEIAYPPETSAEIAAWRIKPQAEKDASALTEQQLDKQWREQAALAEEDSFKRLYNLVEAVKKTNFDHITLVDFSDRLNMKLVYDGRILIELGVEDELAFKLQFVDKVIADELPENFQGRLDASTAYTSGAVWQLACDIGEELQKMQPLAAAGQEQQAGGLPPVSTLPGAQSVTPQDAPGDLAVIPGTALESEAPGGAQDVPPSSPSGREGEEEGSSSRAPEPSSSENDLAVIPGTELAASEPSSST